MKVKSLLLMPFIFTALFFSSCSDNSDSGDANPAYTVPATYTFDRNGTSSVSYVGPTYRLMMLDEMGAYIKTQATAGSVVSETKLSSMYTNTDNQFTLAGLNASNDELKDKTAASVDYFEMFMGGGSVAEQTSVRLVFENTFSSANQASQGAIAAAGVAGSYLDGTSVRLFAANGLEPQQVFLKGMMGAGLLDQIVNNYLSLNILDEDDNRVKNTNKIMVTDQNYTEMEHDWDRAYGYIFGADVSGAVPVLKFWSSYISQVNADSDFNTLSADIDLAFRKGRAAIVNNDYSARDAQINVIKSKLALVAAVRVVFYLQEGKAKLGTDNGAAAFHVLSEAYGFIMSLRYTNKPGTDNPYFSKTEVDMMLTELTSGTNGLWNVTPEILDSLSDDIATRFGFTIIQAATVN